MRAELLAWWLRQMHDLLPPAHRRRGEGGNAWVLELLADAPLRRVALLLRRRGQERAYGQFALDAAGLAALRTTLRRAGGGGWRARVVLRVPAALLLARPIVLPLAAERDLGFMLRYEMDRLTPFTADQVFFTWHVDRRDVAGRRLHLTLLLLARAAVQPLLRALAGAELMPCWLEAPGPAGVPRRVPLQPSTPPHPARRAAMAATIFGMLATAAALPFMTQWQETRAVARRIVALRPAVAQVQVLRGQLAAHRPGKEVFAQERVRVGDALHILAVLTDVLPDDTFLTDLRLQSGRLTLDGESAAAALLIPALAANKLFRAPTFAAPVTRLPNRAAELFSIRAELARETAP